jgi:hypothetical protein
MPSFFDIMTDGAPTYVMAIAHDRATPPRSMLARCAADVETFIRKHDAPGVGCYFAVARLKEGAQARSTETVQETLWLWADIDFKDHPALTPAEIDEHIAQMRYPPTIVVNSGHGRHLYWALHEPEDLTTPEGRRRVIEALQAACRHVAGDPSVCDVTRLMRLPGSHNRKNGDCIPVEMRSCTGHEYDLDELVEAWREMRPILPERRPTNGGGNGHGPADEPFSTFADQYRAPIDVAARLAAMRFEGPGETSIHVTQLACMASLLSSGVPLVDATARVLDATRQCVAGDPRAAQWNWAKEERDVEKSGIDWIAKHPELGCDRNAGNGYGTSDGFDQEIERLAKLSLHHYEHEREGAAAELGMRVSVLDRVVRLQRKKRGLESPRCKAVRSSCPSPHRGRSRWSAMRCSTACSPPSSATSYCPTRRRQQSRCGLCTPTCST